MLGQGRNLEARNLCSLPHFDHARLLRTQQLQHFGTSRQGHRARYLSGVLPQRYADCRSASLEIRMGYRARCIRIGIGHLLVDSLEAVKLSRSLIDRESAMSKVQVAAKNQGD
jgi:hypothetical protein